MSTHTPGPWIAILDKPSTKNPMAMVVTSEQSEFCSPQAIDCTGSGLNFRTDCYNAHLIAAAPDLLAALQYALDNLDAANKERLITAPAWFQVQLGETAKHARAAIARAMGEV